MSENISSSSPEQRTLKDLADSARRRGRDHYGDSAWAMMCLAFDVQIPDGNDYLRFISVLLLMAVDQSDKVMQLGCVWLDTQGYGDRSVEWLAGELARVR